MANMDPNTHYRIPWLIWIQILILLLLMLLFCFTLSVLDLSSSSSSPDFQFSKIPIFKQTTTITLASQIEERQIIEEEKINKDKDKGTSRMIVRGEERVEMEGSSRKGYDHPCDYLRVAFLKCFGLHFLSSDHNSSITEHTTPR